MIDDNLRLADDAALALRYDAAEADAAGDREKAAHLGRAADGHNVTRVTLRRLRMQIDVAIAKAKEPTT